MIDTFFNVAIAQIQEGKETDVAVSGVPYTCTMLMSPLALSFLILFVKYLKSFTGF